MNKDDFKKIAELMIESAQNILISHSQKWLNEKYPDHKILFKVGSGRRTYHVYKKSSKTHIIVFGIKMIESKTLNFSSLKRWTTYSEIYNRKYFNSIGNIQTSLAATVVHEVAHLFQNLIYGRIKNSVHNDEFYSVLDKMHKNGHAEKVYNYLMQYEIFKCLEFKEKINGEESIYEDIKNICLEESFKVGSAAYFIASGTVCIDIITSVNKLNVKCKACTVRKKQIFRIEDDINKIDKNLLLQPKEKPKYSKDNIYVGDYISFNIKSSNIEQKVIKKTKLYAYTNYYKVPYSLILKKNVDF